MTLKQMVNLNDDFLEIATDVIQNQLETMDVDMEAIMPLGVRDKILDSDNGITSDVQSYFTSNEMVIILSVPHAVGDYIEARIPIAAIETFVH